MVPRYPDTQLLPDKPGKTRKQSRKTEKQVFNVFIEKKMRRVRYHLRDARRQSRLQLAIKHLLRRNEPVDFALAQKYLHKIARAEATRLTASPQSSKTRARTTPPANRGRRNGRGRRLDGCL